MTTAMTALLTCLNKIETVLNLVGYVALALQDFPRVFQSNSRAIEQLVGFGQRTDGFFGEVIAF